MLLQGEGGMVADKEDGIAATCSDNTWEANEVCSSKLSLALVLTASRAGLQERFEFVSSMELS